MTASVPDSFDTAAEPALHPTAFIAASADVVGDVTLGPHSSVWYGCVLRGDIAPIRVGARSNIQDLTMVHVDLDTPTYIGDEVGVGHRAIIHGCVIEDRTLIGMGAIILSRARIGEGSVVAAGALVTEGTIVPPGSLVIGSPGRVVREVDGELRARVEMTVNSYARLKDRHASGRWKPAT